MTKPGDTLLRQRAYSTPAGYMIQRELNGNTKQYTPAKMARLFRHFAKREKEIEVVGSFWFVHVKTATGRLTFQFR